MEIQNITELYSKDITTLQYCLLIHLYSIHDIVTLKQGLSISLSTDEKELSEALQYINHGVSILCSYFTQA